MAWDLAKGPNLRPHPPLQGRDLHLTHSVAVSMLRPCLRQYAEVVRSLGPDCLGLDPGSANHCVTSSKLLNLSEHYLQNEGNNSTYLTGLL